MKNKLISGMLIMMMAVTLLTACGESDSNSKDIETSSQAGVSSETGTSNYDGVIINNELANTMTTVGGTEFKLNESNACSAMDYGISNQSYDRESGYGVYLSEKFMNYIQDKMVCFMEMPAQGTSFIYCDIDMGENEGCFEVKDDEIVEVFKFVKEEKGQSNNSDEKIYNKYLIYSDEDFDYNYYVIKDENAVAMSDDAKVVIAELLTYSDEIKSNAFIFPAQENGNNNEDITGDFLEGNETNTDGVSFGEFSGKTVEGNDISNDIFTDYDLTMVNIWGTFCEPCIEEMDELEELYKKLPENINMITICYDADGQMELVKQILETKGATFDTVVVDDTMRSTVLKDYMTFPTTVFIDNDGNIVGSSMLGGPSSSIAETYMEEINSRLSQFGE